MDITKKVDRTSLKSYFIKNATPTAGNFADLIEGAINQKEDGLAKLAGEPLSVQADGDATSQKKAINFYKSFADATPAWTLSLNPRADPNNPASNKTGWSISDAAGNSKLFIDQTSGNVGIGTVEPGAAKLSVAGSFKATSDVSGERAIGLETPASANHRGDGAQTATGLAYRVLQNPAAGEPIFQVRSAGQAVRFFVEHDGWTGSRDNSAWFGGGLKINYFANNVGIGTMSPTQRLHVTGGNAIVNNAFVGDVGHGSNWAGFCHSNSTNTTGYGFLHHVNGLYSLINKKSGGGYISLRVDNADKMVLNDAGDVGIGTSAPRAKLEVQGGAIMPATGNATTAGIQFPPNPGGGGSDAAWLRYYPRSGEACTLELGIGNDGDDHIALMSSGNVGVGTTTPVNKLDVVGDIAVRNKHAIRGNDEWLRFNQDGAFSNGTHTPGLFAPMSLNVGGSGGWVNPGNGNASIAGVVRAANFMGPLTSGNGRYVLWMQDDRNLVMYTVGGGAFWATSTNVSDINLKTDLKPISNALEKLQSLRGIAFSWKEKEEMGEGEQIGVVAQEVEKVFPQLVFSVDERKLVNYQGLIPVLIEAVKEQHARVGELRAEIQALRAAK